MYYTPSLELNTLDDAFQALVVVEKDGETALVKVAVRARIVEEIQMHCATQ